MNINNGGRKNVEDILARIERMAEHKHKASVDDIVEAVGSRGYGPFLLVPALIEVSPIGGIPGLPTVIALLIALFAFQIVVGRRHLWVPAFLGRRRLRGRKLKRATEKLNPLARRLDRWFHGRMAFFTSAPFQRVAALFCILLACTVPPLELIPFASSAPMAAIAMVGLALLVSDGLLMLIAAFMGAGAFAFVAYLAMNNL